MTGLCTGDRTTVHSLRGRSQRRAEPSPVQQCLPGPSLALCPRCVPPRAHRPALTEARPWWPSPRPSHVETAPLPSGPEAHTAPPDRPPRPHPSSPRHPGALGPLVLQAAWASAEACSAPSARPAGGAAVPWGWPASPGRSGARAGPSGTDVPGLGLEWVWTATRPSPRAARCSRPAQSWARGRALGPEAPRQPHGQGQGSVSGLRDLGFRL